MSSDPLAQRFVEFRTTGDVDKFAEVYAATIARLTARARRRLHDSDLADDVVQATYLTAIEARERFRAEERMMPWLTGILANHVRHLLRRRRETQLEVEPTSDETPLRYTSRQEIDDLVRAGIEKLPVHYRTVLHDRLLGRLSPTTIAEQRELPVATVKSRLQRGLDLLRRQLTFAVGALVAARVQAASLSPAGPAPAPRPRPTWLLTIATVGVAAAAVAWQNGGDVPAPSNPPASVSHRNVSAPAATPGRDAATPIRINPPAADAVTPRLVRLRFAQFGPDQPMTDCQFRILRQDPDGSYGMVIHDRPDATGTFSWHAPRKPGRFALIAIASDGERRVQEFELTQSTVEVPTIIFRPQIYLHGVVRHRDGTAAAQATVHILASNGDRTRVAAADAAGHFEATVENATACWASLPGFGPTTAQPLRAHGGAIEVDWRLGEATQGRQVVVRDTFGHPVAGALVLIDGRDGPPWLDATTDATGLAVFPSAPAGTRDALCFHSDFAPNWRRLTRLESQIELDHGGTIRGVVRTFTDQPLADVAIQVVPAEMPPGIRAIDIGRFRTQVRTNASGQYRLDGITTATPVSVYAFANGHADARCESINLTAGSSTDWSPRLGNLASLRGHVLDAAGQPLPEVEVWARPVGSSTGSTTGVAIDSVRGDTVTRPPSWSTPDTLVTITDSHGAFALLAPPDAGLFELWTCERPADDRPSLPCADPVLARPGAIAITLRARPHAATLSFALVDLPAGTTFALEPVPTGPHDRAPLRTHTLELRGVPTGHYELRIDAPLATLSHPLHIAGTETLDLGRLALEPTPRLKDTAAGR